MKRVIQGKELEAQMEKAIKLLCDTVKITLGPKGRNVIIDHSDFSPFITNDGVTIAKNIESDDPTLSTILELAKEASLKTDENVGDGTTTTLVLLEKIFLEGSKIIRKGANPIILKKELERALNETLSELKKGSKLPSTKDIEHIASISANDKEIGKILSEAYQKVGSKSIYIKEHDKEITTVAELNGYFFETIIASPYFFQGKNKINLKSAIILIANKEILEIEELSEILNTVIEKKKDCLIIAKDYDDDLINSILDIRLTYDLNIILLKIAGYGVESYETICDLESIINRKSISNNERITIEKTGIVQSVEITNEQTKINFQKTEKIENRLKELKKELLAKDNIEKQAYEKRISMYENGLIEINVGAITATERREKKMRFIDALCAIRSADKGIVPGGGILYFKISENIKTNTNGEKILKEALKEPIKQILENAALNVAEILDKIRQNNFQILYNVSTDNYEKLSETHVTDTLEVLENSLKNACSIASMLLTTSSIIINEYRPNIKNDHYIDEIE